MEYEAHITLFDLDLRVTFDYQPAEKMVMYYSDGSGYPGCSESFEINKVDLLFHDIEIDITRLCESLFDEIEQAIIDQAPGEED